MHKLFLKVEVNLLHIESLIKIVTQEKISTQEKTLKRALLSSAQPASAKSKWSFLLLARVITNNDDHDGDNCNVYKSWYMACNDCLVHKTMANCNLDPIYSKLNP
jgi:hypothetical protein